MKKFAVVMMVAVALFFSATISFAEEDKEEKDGWGPALEAGLTFKNRDIDPYSGEIRFNHPVFVESITIGLEKVETIKTDEKIDNEVKKDEKNETDDEKKKKNRLLIYFNPENYNQLNRNDYGQTSFFTGLYAERWGMKFDVGYAYYRLKTGDELNYKGIYADADFPKIWWQIVPFIGTEYRFAVGRSEDENGRNISLDGFVYRAGLKREFKINKKLSAVTSVSGGGNFGIYGLPAENLAFLQGDCNLSYAIDDHWKINLYGMIPVNLGRRDGVAAGTSPDRPVIGLTVLWTY